MREPGMRLSNAILGQTLRHCLPDEHATLLRVEPMRSEGSLQIVCFEIHWRHGNVLGQPAVDAAQALHFKSDRQWEAIPT
jgi:hypothetical protein